MLFIKMNCFSGFLKKKNLIRHISVILGLSHQNFPYGYVNQWSIPEPDANSGKVTLSLVTWE